MELRNVNWSNNIFLRPDAWPLESTPSLSNSYVIQNYIIIIIIIIIYYYYWLYDYIILVGLDTCVEFIIIQFNVIFKPFHCEESLSRFRPEYSPEGA